MGRRLELAMPAIENGFSREEKYLLELLRASLCSDAGKQPGNEVDWRRIWYLAERHKVLPLLYDVMPGNLREKAVREEAEKAARKTVKQSYRLLFLSRYLQELLHGEGIQSILLKGAATASFYPVPELRKSGDIDLLIPEKKDLDRACRILQKDGFAVRQEQNSRHHVVCTSEEGIGVELHQMLAEPFDNRRINRYLEKIRDACAQECEEKEIMGVSLTILKPGFHAYHLLIHMLQHFLRAGFGLKLLCDWVVFWNQEVEEQEVRKFLSLTEESGLLGFCSMVTAVCIGYLGLDISRVKWIEAEILDTEVWSTEVWSTEIRSTEIRSTEVWSTEICSTEAAKKKKVHGRLKAEDVGTAGKKDIEEFMREILDAEEFGKSAPDRMVVMRGSSAWDYIREFHHQMQLNFPDAGKVFLFWPVLWSITLIRFLKNNRKIRQVSGMEILRKAGERSRLMEKMRLFETMKRKQDMK